MSRTPLNIKEVSVSVLKFQFLFALYIKTLGVKNWRNVAMEKESWQKLLRKARPT
jgi:hypothetical protein